MIKISEMSEAEKIVLMERLWADLRSAPAKFESPAWHGELLSTRQKRIDAGTEQILDWDDAKRQIQTEIS